MDLLNPSNYNEEEKMTKKNQNRVWFAFVMGLLLFGIGMIIWTVKQTTSVHVQESNNYMLKYQTAEMNINEIMKREANFNAKYTLTLQNRTLIKLEEDLQNSNAKRVQKQPVELSLGQETFSYAIRTKSGETVQDANVSFLLTRPHTRVDDHAQEHVNFNGTAYVTKPLELSKKGRYTLMVKVVINDAIGYLETPAYLK